MAKKKILIVDDEDGMREMLSFRLRANGFDVATAQDGVEGLEKIVSERPNLIILDVMMPKMDGFTFFKELKKNPRGSDNVPVVMLTARGKMRDTFEALEADAFVSKPFDPKDLLAVINDIIRQKVLVLTTEFFVKDKLGKAGERCGCDIDFAEDEKTFFQKVREKKYRAVFVHLACVKETPEQFMSGLKTLKDASPAVIVYSDATVKGLETGHFGALQDVKDRWKACGIEQFYDSRIISRSLEEIMDRYLT
ncbi:MAG: response regulator [Candidatus Omnitrophota bacterium]